MLQPCLFSNRGCPPFICGWSSPMRSRSLITSASASPPLSPVQCVRPTACLRWFAPPANVNTVGFTFGPRSASWRFWGIWINSPLGPQEPGQLVVTGLLAEEMPLIRYRIGDRGALSDELCSCGRGLPLLQSIEGRSDDLILTPDGRRVGRLDPIFKADIAIREAQIVQESLQHITVRLVPTQGYTPADGEAIIQALRQRVGDMAVSLEPVAEIPRGPNGKFRAVVSRLAEHDDRFPPCSA